MINKYTTICMDVLMNDITVFFIFTYQSAASCYIELIVKESDNNVKLIVLDRLIALKDNPSHEKVLRVSFWVSFLLHVLRGSRIHHNSLATKGDWQIMFLLPYDVVCFSFSLSFTEFFFFILLSDRLWYCMRKEKQEFLLKSKTTV